MTVTEFLQSQVPFLEGLTPEQARGLAEQAEQRQFSKGQTVLFKGTTVDGLYIVASGSVTVWVKAAKAATATQVAELQPGDVFGETSIIEMGTAGATIKSGSDDTMIFVIEHDAFRGILESNEAFRVRAQALIESRKKKNSEFLTPVLMGLPAVPAAA